MKMYESQHLDNNLEVMVMRLGEVAVMGLPSETFCEFALEIKAKSPSKHTLVIELANDAVGYLPTGDAYEAGGYNVSPGATQYEKGGR